MNEELNQLDDPFEEVTDEPISYAAERASILEDLTGSIIRDHGVFLVTGSMYTGRELFLDELKQKLILKGCAVFKSSRPFDSFSDYVYDCLQQQSQGDHSRMDMLPLKSDGANLFFDGNQLSLFVIDEASQFSDEVILEIIQTMTRANEEGHHVATLLADELLMNDRLERIGCQDLIVSSSIIPALDPAVVRDYIEGRMKLSGEDFSAVVYSPGAIREITELAKGDLNQVNHLCKQSLQIAMNSEDKIVTVHMVKEGGSDRFFKIQDGDSSSKKTSVKRPVSRNASWLSLFLFKIREHAFATTAALIPLILVGFYFKFSIEDQERADLLTQRKEARVSATNNARITESVDIDDKELVVQLDSITNKQKEFNVSQLDAFSEKNVQATAISTVDNAPVLEGKKQGNNKVVLEQEPTNVASVEAIEALVDIEPAVSKPLSVLPAVIGNEDSAVLLKVGLGVGQRTANRYIEVSGVPQGASLSQGTRYGDLWVLSPEQLPGLKLIPSVDSDHDYQLTIQLKDSIQHTVLAEDKLPIQIQAVADKPIMSFSGATGDQFTAIPVEISARLADRDGSESLSIEIVGLPDSVQISAGQKNESGIWVLLPKDLDGLILTPMDGAPTELNLLIMAVATELENNSRAVVSGTLSISIIPGSR